MQREQQQQQRKRMIEIGFVVHTIMLLAVWATALTCEPVCVCCALLAWCIFVWCWEGLYA